MAASAAACCALCLRAAAPAVAARGSADAAAAAAAAALCHQQSAGGHTPCLLRCCCTLPQHLPGRHRPGGPSSAPLAQAGRRGRWRLEGPQRVGGQKSQRLVLGLDRLTHEAAAHAAAEVAAVAATTDAAHPLVAVRCQTTRPGRPQSAPGQQQLPPLPLAQPAATAVGWQAGQQLRSPRAQRAGRSLAATPPLRWLVVAC